MDIPSTIPTKIGPKQLEKVRPTTTIDEIRPYHNQQALVLTWLLELASLRILTCPTLASNTQLTITEATSRQNNELTTKNGTTRQRRTLSSLQFTRSRRGTDLQLLFNVSSTSLSFVDVVHKHGVRQTGWGESSSYNNNNNNLVYIAPVCQTDFRSALGQSQFCVPVAKPKCLTKIVSL